MVSPHPDPVNLTPTEKKILRKLSDSGLHKRDELVACMEDPEATSANMHAHLVNIRKKLLPLNQTVCCVVIGRRRFYRRMILYVPFPDSEQDDLPQS